MSEVILIRKTNSPIASLILNRPERRNALNPALMDMLQKHLDVLSQDPQLRVLILRGIGDHFCAGADLMWLKEGFSLSVQESEADAARLRKLLSTLATFPVPLIGLVHGAIFGGAIGLVACCDLVLASPDARFCFSETKLGLIPALISPFVRHALPLRILQRYWLTAEVFTAEEALAWHFVHQVVSRPHWQAALQLWIDHLLGNGPHALRMSKHWVRDLQLGEMNEATLLARGVGTLATLRQSSEVQEGIRAFFEKRAPTWAIRLPLEEGDV